MSDLLDNMKKIAKGNSTMVEVAKWLTRGVVAPLFAGSNPVLYPEFSLIETIYYIVSIININQEVYYVGIL
jgi:hypothetical protein